MTQDQFFDFCQLNADKRFERTAEGELIVMAPSCGESGFRDLSVAAQLYNWAMRVGNRTVATEGRITQAEFMDACKADIYAPRKAEEGAPLKGANSFTEGQAKDRAIAHGSVESVSGLKKDDDGIWRGTGSQGGKTVEIAVDYKGNVVTKAQQ